MNHPSNTDYRRRYTDPPLDIEAERRRLQAEIGNSRPEDRTKLYIIGVVTTCFIAMVSVVAVTIVRQTADNTAIYALIIAFMTPIIGGLMAGIANEMKHKVDGRLTDLLLAERAAARLQGRQDPRTPRPGQKVSDK